MELPESIKDLPKSVVDELFDRIERDPIIRKLRDKQKAAYVRRDYIEAIKLKNDIEEVKQQVLKLCFERQQKEFVKLEEIMRGMDAEDVATIVEFSNAIAMCCDMIEGLVMDMQEVCKKYEQGMEIVSYSKITDIGEVVKDQLRLLNSNTDWHYLGKFGDTSDDMRKMLLNKVKKMLREVTKNGKVERTK